MIIFSLSIFLFVNFLTAAWHFLFFNQPNFGGFYPIAIIGEADGDDDEDKYGDDGDHHHVGSEQCCQVVWFSTEENKS